MDYTDEADLSGDDLKMVSYSIIYREADHEAMLHAAETVVDHDTTEDSFRAMMLAIFLKSLEVGISIPASWRDGNHPAGDFGYAPDDQSPETFSAIPQNKQKHLEVMVQVVAQRQTTDESGAEVKRALQDIAEQLGNEDQE